MATSKIVAPIEALAGATNDLRIALSAAPVLAAPASEPAEPSAPVLATNASTPSTESHAGPGVGPVVVMSVGGALLITGVVTGILARDLHSDLEERCDPDVSGR